MEDSEGRGLQCGLGILPERVQKIAPLERSGETLLELVRAAARRTLERADW